MEFTVSDLVVRIRKYFNEEPYSFKYMFMVITKLNGKQNVVTFISTVSESLHKFYSKPKEYYPSDFVHPSLRYQNLNRAVISRIRMYQTHFFFSRQC